MARLQKKPVERFQEEQITVERLYTLAENSLLGEEKNQPPLFRFLSDGGTLAISLQKPSSKTLNLPANSPAIFHAYPEHLYAGQPFFLDLRQAMGSHTIGYRLLEKSFAAKNHQAMEMLLENGADILEAPPRTKEACWIKCLMPPIRDGGIYSLVTLKKI